MQILVEKSQMCFEKGKGNCNIKSGELLQFQKKNCFVLIFCYFFIPGTTLVSLDVNQHFALSQNYSTQQTAKWSENQKKQNTKNTC